MPEPEPTGETEARSGLPPAALLVAHPSAQRSRVVLDPLPFFMGRQAENQLALRDNRISRVHARITASNGSYIIEDLSSRHGTWINGERIARRVLRNGDRIEFGVHDSYQLTFALERGEITRMLDHLSSGSQPGGMGSNHLAKLRSLVEVARALQNSLSTQEVLAAVVDAALAVTGCERGFLLLRPDTAPDTRKDAGLETGKTAEPDAELEVSVARDRNGTPLEADDLRVPTSVIQRALQSRHDLLSMSFDPLAGEGARPETTVADLELRSVVCLPLIRIRSGSSEDTLVSVSVDNTVGLLYLDSRAAPADLSGGNRELLQTLAIEASTILENARLIEEERAKLRIENELNIARDIQRGLQPTAMPDGGWFRACGSSIAATQVGGDYFDVRQISPDVWSAVVADVSGKGVSSALLASLLQGTFLMASADPAQVEPTMSRLNEFLLERTQGEKYATVFFCMMDSSGLLSYSNAGHCAPFLVSPDGRMRKLHTSGMPVGMIEGATFPMVQTQLAAGDKIVIYSDGLTEAENAEGIFYDTERLRLCLREHATYDAARLHAALLEAVDAFTEGGVIGDDITALVLEYSPV